MEPLAASVRRGTRALGSIALRIVAAGKGAVALPLVLAR
jgi:hypothetical protein